MIKFVNTQKTGLIVFSKEINQKKVGTVAINAKISPILEIQWLSIEKEYRNCGYGSELLRHVINFSKISKFSTVILTAQPSKDSIMTEESLVMWYEKFGFKMDKHQEGDQEGVKMTLKL
jgi:ribosomal protein S18 acetylase RimI-like enzyme